MKTYFKNEPIFKKSKVVTSIYENDMGGVLNKNLKEKIKFDDISINLDSINKPDYNSLLSLALDYSDGAITYSYDLGSNLRDKLKKFDAVVLDFEKKKKKMGTLTFKKYFL